jgi:limonene 1,2-monooxygenase
MAVTSIVSPTGVIAAGKHGLGVLTMGGVSDDLLERYHGNWGICEEVAAEHGNTVSRDNWRVAMMIHCAESKKQAEADMAFGLDDWGCYATEVLPQSPIPVGTKDPLAHLRDNKLAVFGTPDDVIADIERVSEGVGGFGTVLVFATNWANWEATKRSYELISRYVMPHFAGSLQGRRDSYDWSNAHHTEFTKSFGQATEASKKAWEKRKSGPGAAKASKNKAAE